MVDVLEGMSRFYWKRLGEQHPDSRIKLVDLAERDDARAVLASSRAVAQARFAGIPGTRVYLGEAMAHERNDNSVDCNVSHPSRTQQRPVFKPPAHQIVERQFSRPAAQHNQQ